MAAKQQDNYVNFAYSHVQESVAGTLESSEINTGYSMQDKIAWIIHRVRYEFTGAVLALIAATADSIQAGVATAGSFTASGPIFFDPNVISKITLSMDAFGAVSGATIIQTIFDDDLSGLPGGGIIIPARPVYSWVLGTSLASAASVQIRIMYTTKSLTTEDYWELVESRRVTI